MDGVVVETIDEVTRAVAITIEPSEVRAKYNKELSKATSKASIRGFRPGKVPKNIVEQRFGAEIRRDVVDEFLREAVNFAVTSQTLELASRPVIDDLKEMDGGLTARLTLSLVPRPDLSDLDSVLAAITVTVPTADREALIGEILERLRYDMSSLEPVEGRTTAELGDVVRYRRVEIGENGEELEDTANITRFRLRSLESIRATPQLSAPSDEKLVTTLLGKRVGEQWEEESTPQQTEDVEKLDLSEELGISATDAAVKKDGEKEAPKSAPRSKRYRVTCEEILTPSITALTDEQAQEFLGGEDVGATRQKAEAFVDELIESERERVVVEQVVDALSKRYQFMIPRPLIDEQKRQIARRAFKFEGPSDAVDAILNSPLGKIIEFTATESLRKDILLDRIAEGEGIAISTSDQLNDWATNRAYRVFGNEALDIFRGINSHEKFEGLMAIASRDIARQHVYRKATSAPESSKEGVAANE